MTTNVKTSRPAKAKKAKRRSGERHYDVLDFLSRPERLSTGRYISDDVAIVSQVCRGRIGVDINAWD